MGVGITFGMAVISRRWHQAGQAGKDVPCYIRVSILVDCQASRRMRHVNVTDATFHAGFRQFGRHNACDIYNLDSGTSRNINLCPRHILTLACLFRIKSLWSLGRIFKNLLPGMETIMQRKETINPDHHDNLL
jgi:hypothetical protein